MIDLAIPVISFVFAGGGAYLGSYLKKKGENLATHEDLNLLVKQMEATTAATKAIEAKISNEVWDRQKQWEMKKEAVMDVVAALGKADDALISYSVAIEADRASDDKAKYLDAKVEASDAMYDARNDFEMKRTISLLVCGKKFNDASFAVMQELRRVTSRISQDGAVYLDFAATLGPAIARVFAHARHELGIPRDEPSE